MNYWFLFVMNDPHSIGFNRISCTNTSDCHFDVSGNRFVIR